VIVMLDRYSAPEVLAEVTNAPLPLCQLIFIVTAGDRRHLAMLRADGKGDSITSEERYAITWVARQFMHVSFPQIGRALSIDHSSAIRGYNRAKLLRMTDHEFRAMTDALAAKMPTRHAVQKRARRIAAR
jgi:hypothetical protein